jgi:hypothetical protein
MLNRITLAAAFFLATLPASAWDSAPPQDEFDYTPACSPPAAPAAVDATTQAQLAAEHDAVDAFMTASDSYQRCLGRALGARQDLAFFAKTNVPVVVTKQIDRKARDNQHQKEKVGRDYNAAAAAFQAKNGKP